MRKVTFGVGSSLDGFIAREDGSVDWLRWGREVGRISGQYWRTIDTVLMGRKTCEAAPSEGYPGVKNYVFSGTWKHSPKSSVELVQSDACAFVRKLKKSRGKGICVMGGGELASSLFQAGLIDEIGVNIHPVLLGRGIPLFLPMESQVDLERVECTPFANGCVYVLYRVRR
jgi:dihydrofolate reductase